MAYSNNGSSRGDILRELVDNFGKTLNLATIQEVVKKNDFDAYKSKLALLQLSSSNNNTLSFQADRYNSRFSVRPAHGTISKVPNPHNYVSTFAFEDTIDDILKNYRVMVLLRGLPGSGKSYLANYILNASIGRSDPSDHIFSADNFFMKSGRYYYDVTKIDEAHNWAQRNVFQKMLKGYSPVIIDNTHTQLWEMKPYAQMATQCGYKIRILETNTKWSFDCTQLALKNKHGVPKAKIKIMLDRYTRNVTPEFLLTNFNLLLKFQSNPLQRNYPPVSETCLSVPSVSSTMNTSSVHNHNSMNQDLKLPDLCNSQQPNAAWSNSQCEVSNLIEISDDDDEANTRVNDVSPSTPRSSSFSPENIDYSTWGVDEKILKSWDIVTPLRAENESIQVNPSSDGGSHEKPQTVEKGTNTCVEDFHRNSEDSNILFAHYRDINPVGKKSIPNKSGMLDKSCSTQDDICSDRNEDLKKLADIFQKIPPLYIRDMYDDCKGDFDMTFEIFLEDDKDYSDVPFTKNNIICDSDAEHNSQRKRFKINLEELLENHSEYSSSGHSPPFNIIEPLIEEVNQHSSSLEDHSENSSVGHSSPSKTFEEVNQHFASRDSTLVSCPLELPSTSKSAVEKVSTDNLLMLDSDSDLEFDHSPSQAESDDKSEDNDIIELNLGPNLIEQLEKEFGDPVYDYPKGFQPVVQVPKAFARQLYASYVESVYQQMETQKSVLDKLIKEDEALAKKLFEEENGMSEEPKPESLQDIMNEQAARNIYEKDISQWKNCTPSDFASQLTTKKLCATFPTVDKNILLEIYHANERNYKQTVEDLLISVDPSEVHDHTNIKDVPISQPLLEELEKAHLNYNAAKDGEENRTSQSYRDEANGYLKNRQELYQKAQEYYSKGQKEVAQFYSQLAQKQTQFYDMANSRAATVLLEEHSQRLQNFDTLDLHYLFVKEAIPALDVFIDRHINLLNGGTKVSQNLLVITGRGNRSKNGLSKIKPAVISRLKARKIQYVHLNPGLLKIKVNRNAVMTSDI